MSKKFLILKGESSYDTLRAMADRLYGALVGAASAEMFDLVSTSEDTVRSRLLAVDYDAVISLNAVFSDLTLSFKGNSVPLMSALPVPHICWMVDDLTYHAQRLSISNPKRIVLSSSTSHALMLNDLHWGKGHALFFPGVGADLLQRNERDRRSIDAIVVGSWMGHPDPFWHQLPKPTQTFITEILELVTSGQFDNAYLAFKDASSRRGISVDWSQEIANLLSLVETHLRQQERLQLVQLLKDKGLHIAVVGSGWDEFLQSEKVTVVPPCSNYEMLQWYQKSRITVNFNARNGASERLFDALSMGCAVLSAWNASLANLVPEDLGVRYFHFPSQQSGPLAVTSLLDTTPLTGLPMELSHRLVEHHAWSRRASQIVSLLPQ